MVRKIKYYIVDVFTNEHFGGNQLAVIPDATHIDESVFQKIAKEFNFSETTFVLPPENPANDFKLRIFTPNIEIPTAGHPTIGTSFVLLSHEQVIPVNENKLVLEELVGDIEVFFTEKDSGFHNITMKQPLPKYGDIYKDIETMAKILGIESEKIRNDIPMQAISCGNNFLFVPLTDQSAMQHIKINTALLDEHKENLPSTEIYVFTFDTTIEDSTTHGRMFAPLFGIHEDAATGSASGPLGCYLVKHDLHNGNDIICEQGFEMGRPSYIDVNILHSNKVILEVKVGGNSILSSKGELHIGPESKSFVSTVLNKI